LIDSPGLGNNKFNLYHWANRYSLELVRLQAQISLCVVVISWHDEPDIKDTETFAVSMQAFANKGLRNFVFCFNNCKNVDKGKARAFLSAVVRQSNFSPNLVDRIN
jgi:hypothetical protein